MSLLTSWAKIKLNIWKSVFHQIETMLVYVTLGGTFRHIIGCKLDQLSGIDQIEVKIKENVKKRLKYT